MPHKQIYKYVRLKTSVPEYKLVKGDVAMAIDRLNGGKDLPKAYVLEAFNALGETLGVFTLPCNEVEDIHENEVLHARQIA